MAETWEQNDVQGSDFIYDSVLLYSSRTVEPVEIKSLVSALEIYEHMDKPYLTGTLAIADTVSLLDRFDFQGAEYIDIQVKRNLSGPIYKKTFVVQKMKTNKVNQTSEVAYFNIVEDVAFKSALKNVNKYYRGKPSKIIKTISKEYLGKEVLSTRDVDYQGEMQVIVPNLDPIESLMWMKQRATSGEGYPYFLYSVFGSEKLQFIDLGHMLETPVINEKQPYVYSPAGSVSEGLQQFVVIDQYKHEKVEDLISMIQRGLIGGKHNYYNSMTMSYDEVNFNIQKDVAQTAKVKNPRQGKFNVASNWKIDDEKLESYDSRHMYRISTGGAYQILSGSFNSYSEEKEIGGHRKKVIAEALKHMLAKSVIQIKVSGREFMTPIGVNPKNFTIGNSIRLVFLANIDQSDGQSKLDPKKSGDYIIFAAKHSLGGERYDITLTCAKIANYNSNEFSLGGQK